ncbi:MAG TPA: fused MFS/spermidine synthase, partial [Candidatus Ozemobacteraceae bacterium]|nr:fused MFS/spermidine synthase [Candidatus Ozemobacteraceae bacterium]
MDLTVLRFALTSFLGSFLSFVMQPMAGKAVLPVHGGSYMVWAATLCFFQLTLLLGYAFAHLLFSHRVTVHRCLFWTITLIVTAIAVPPVLDPLRRSAPLFASPGIDILGRLVIGFGSPAVMLFAGSIMLQRFWRSTPGSAGREPLIYYAASNVGSLGALIGYLFFIEPHLSLVTQEYALRLLYPFWILCFVTCIPWQPTEELDPSLFLSTSNASPSSASGVDREQPVLAPAVVSSMVDRGALEPAIAAPDTIPELPAHALFLQAAAGSSLLASTTTLLTLDVSPMPFLWVAPLTIYLLTYIRVFSHSESAHHAATRWFVPALAIGFSLALIHQLNFALGILPRLALHLAVLYYLCLACHSRFLVAGPPAPHRLTRFYLFIAAGGAAGTVAVNLLAVFAFDRLQEFNLCLLLTAAAFRGVTLPPTTLTRRATEADCSWSFAGDPFFVLRALAIIVLFLVFPSLVNQGMPITSSFLPPVAAGAMVYGWLALRTAERLGGRETASALLIAVSILFLPDIGAPGTEHLSRRTWYGLYRVYDQGDIRFLQMGSTFHGGRWLDPTRAHEPLLYYHPETTIGRFFSTQSPTWQRAAAIGLGAGMLSAFTRPGQELTYLELDPVQVDIARRWFPFLDHASGSITVQTGDGRLLLRNATSTFDLIVFDAFSSDSIPTHLLTLEAHREALLKLASGGMLLYNISNRHLNLLPVLAANADVLGLSMLVSRNQDSDDPWRLPTRWVALGTRSALARHLGAHDQWLPLPRKP